jgi:ureidoacrylate peracid hydrolase
MHKVTVRQEIIDRVVARRGRYHWFEDLDPRRTALVVIDMQELFCAPGAAAEVAGSREIVEPINALTEELRTIGVPVIWVLHANAESSGRSDWELFFNYIVADSRELGAGPPESLVRPHGGTNRHDDHQKPLQCPDRRIFRA